jgi:hypothetical protein
VLPDGGDDDDDVDDNLDLSGSEVKPAPKGGSVCGLLRPLLIHLLPDLCGP